jgi:hypothetical protein
MKAVLVNSQNIVDNVIVWHEGDVWNDHETVVVVDDEVAVGPGYTFNGGTSFTAPDPTPIPDEIRIAFEARAAAKQAALNKLMALGLTEEEALAFGNI